MRGTLQTLLFFQREDIRAQAYESSSGFTVQADSTASRSVSRSFAKTPSLSRLRQKLIDTGVLVSKGDVMRFTRDYEFSSPSTAATIVCAAPTNGRVFWRTNEGVTLKDIQNAKALSSAGQGGPATIK